MSWGKNSGDEISSGEIRRGENMHRNLKRKKCHAAKFAVAKFNAVKNPVFPIEIRQKVLEMPDFE